LHPASHCTELGAGGRLARGSWFLALGSRGGDLGQRSRGPLHHGRVPHANRWLCRYRWLRRWFGPGRGWLVAACSPRDAARSGRRTEGDLNVCGVLVRLGVPNDGSTKEASMNRRVGLSLLIAAVVLSALFFVSGC